jgi:hypothetical protein
LAITSVRPSKTHKAIVRFNHMFKIFILMPKSIIINSGPHHAYKGMSTVIILPIKQCAYVFILP